MIGVGGNKQTVKHERVLELKNLSVSPRYTAWLNNIQFSLSLVFVLRS